MNLTELKHFVTIAKCGSLTKAAEQLYVSQPALSKTIKGLEVSLDTRLFDRIGRVLKLNENGYILLRYALQIFEAMEDAEKEIQDNIIKNAGIVKICLLTCSKILPGFVLHLKKTYPDISFQISQKYGSPECFDLVIFSTGEEKSAPGLELMMKEQIKIAVPKNHKFAMKSAVRLDELSGEPFILLSKPHVLRTITDEYCASHHFRPYIALESDNPSLVREMVSTGFGVSFMPVVTWNDQFTNIRFLDLAQGDLVRYNYISYQTDRYLHSSAKSFKECLKEYLRGLGTQEPT